MFYVVVSSKEIVSYQSKFKEALLSVCDKHPTVRVGYPGGSGINRVHYSTKYGFWFTSKKFDDRYWNSFGLGEPNKHQSNSIVVEINFSLIGLNRGMGGLLVKDSQNIYLAHRGKIGGGRSGVGKNLFVKFYNGSTTEINDGDHLTDVFIISSLSSALLPRKICEFVNAVDEIKSKVLKSRKLTFSSTIRDYFPEHFGNIKSYRVSNINYKESRHGEVVDKLKTLLVNKQYKVGKDKNRDLYTHFRGSITALFEIKTDLRNQSIYSGIGQLLLYKTKLPDDCELYLVLPGRLDRTVSNILHTLGINLIYYSFSSKDIRINLPNYF